MPERPKGVSLLSLLADDVLRVGIEGGEHYFDEKLGCEVFCWANGGKTYYRFNKLGQPSGREELPPPSLTEHV